MPVTQREASDFIRGKDSLVRGYAREALPFLQRAYSQAPTVPEATSWYGLALALASTERERGLLLCQTAANDGGQQLELRINLALAKVACGERKDAWVMLRRLEAEAPEDPRVVRQLKRLGFRKSPVLTFLPRTHPVNRTLGRWRQRLLGAR
jgi:hypothetical protein